SKSLSRSVPQEIDDAATEIAAGLLERNRHVALHQRLTRERLCHLAVRRAPLRHRTAGAVGRSGTANCCTELHECLIPLVAASGRNTLRGQIVKISGARGRLRNLWPVDHSVQRSPDIDINESDVLLEGKTG